MFCYHAVWNMVNLFNCHIDGFNSYPVYLWQQSTAVLFIFISGYCWALSNKHIKRSLIVLGCALFISAFTFLFDNNNFISFGILSFICSAMLLMLPLSKLLRHLPPYGGLILSAALFIFTKNLRHGYAGFADWQLFLPQDFYDSYFTAYFGLPPESFHSADYFPLLPWLFIYTAGYFAYYCSGRFISKTNISNINIRPLSFLGRHSLAAYLIHQPVIYILLRLVL